MSFNRATKSDIMQHLCSLQCTTRKVQMIRDRLLRPTNKRMSWILPGRRCPVYRSPCRWLFSTRGPNPWCRRWRCKTHARWSQPPPGICLEPVKRGGGGGGWAVLLSEINLINILLIVGSHSTCESDRSLPSESKTYEMKTCSALLQTLKLMKGSCSLCSLHIYNE